MLPLTILGLLALVGAVISLLLPETLGTILPETIEDGENFGKDQGFWDFPCFAGRNKMKTSQDSIAAVTRSSGSSIMMDVEPEVVLRRACRMNSLRASIRGEAYRSSLLSNQQTQQLNQRHKTSIKRTLTTA